MKLSFSIPAKSASKSSAKPKPKPSSKIDNGGENKTTVKQFVTEFDSSKTLANSNQSLIIPPKENEWRPHKRMKNIDLLPSLQSEGEGLRFEVATDGDDGDDTTMSYGLNLREQSNADVEDGGPKLGQHNHESTENFLLEKLRYDLQRLPEDRGFEEFKDVPVEGFGAALLAGYGWHEGRGIGKNAKEDVKVKQYHKRTDKEGLGFVTSNDSVKGRDKPKERKRVREKEIHGDADVDGFFVGKDVRVIAGRREILGSKGRILERPNADWVLLKLAERKDELKLRISDIAELGSKEEQHCLRKLKALEIETKQSKDRDMEKPIAKSSKESRETVRRDNDKVKDDRKRWLRNHIRVRIISRDLKGGRVYLKKGEIVDVVGPYVCDISMDETKELVQGVDQDLLETALPRRGGRVLVLYGKHAGVYGNLVQKDLDRETGVVQDIDTQETHTVKLEQVAEYVGDPSYIGY